MPKRNAKCLLTKTSPKLKELGLSLRKKKGVTAVFKDYSLNKATSDSVDNLLKGLEVSVDLKSLDSDSWVRDRNLRKTLFKALKNESKAVVKVKSVEAKTLKTSLLLNGVEKAIDFQLTRTADQLVATGSFDALDFMMKPAIDALIDKCKGLHTGGDGKSKTWSDFALRVTAQLKKTNCP